MAEDSNEAKCTSDQLLVASTSLEYLQGPVKKATRLKYNCVSVSAKLVALGSNTGGIYLFSRSEEKLIQIAFAEKETSAVVMVQLSPNEKFVGFVSSAGTVHVLELKLETKAKPETLRSTSDLGRATVTHLFWDPASTRLYVGDDLGRVSMIPVSSNKAKNLFSTPLEVILKLDSAIVQIDKAEDKLLVSTLTRCFLCNTSKQNYTQIGKKLRDGNYGACFLSQGSETSMIYCARPGSRIWEVDATGSVLNTHQFKQLLSVPPVSVFSPDGEYEGPPEGTFPGQTVNFPKLKILSNNLLLSWNQSTLFILDPVNVKVILWSQDFSGILDVVCLHNEIFIFVQTTELAHISLLPLSEVVSLSLHVDNVVAAAKLCFNFKDVLHHKHVRKKLGLTVLEKIYNRLMDAELYTMAETFQALIDKVEHEIGLESDSSDSGRSRSSSVMSSLSTAEQIVNEPSKRLVSNASSGSLANDKDDECSNDTVVEILGPANSDSFMRDDLDGADAVHNVLESGKHEYLEAVQVRNERGDPLTEEFSKTLEWKEDNIDSIRDEIQDRFEEGESKEIDMNSKSLNNIYMNGNANNVNVENINAIEHVIPNSSQEISNVQNDEFVGESRDSVNTSLSETIVVRDVAYLSKENGEDSTDKISPDENSKDSGISEVQSTYKDNHDVLNKQSYTLHVESVSKSVSPLRDIIETSGRFEDEVDDDYIGDLRSKVLGSRRSSLTSLSSFDSADVSIDQIQPADDPHSQEPIAVAVRRKTLKKKTRRVSLEDREREKAKNSVLSPTGSLQEPIDERYVSLPQGALQGQGQPQRSEEDFLGYKDKLYTEKNADTISISSALSISGDFGHSGIETVKGEELSHSLDHSPTGSPLLDSWESGSQEKTGSSFPSTSKAKFLKMKDRMQTKVTSKTKTLIKNIKDKNLLTKAKELAENFAQPSENFPLGEGFYVEPFDIPTLEFRPESRDIGSREPSFDETDSIAQCLVNIQKLQDRTEQTKAKLQDMATLMNKKAVQMILLDWVTVLNQTFQELHIKMFTQSSNNGMDKVKDKESVTLQRVNEVTKVSDTNDAVKEDSAQHMVDEEIQPSAINVDVSNTGNSDEAEESYGATILKDIDFCYINDPLNLKPNMFKDVCELAQACFDISAHGDILKYQTLNQYVPTVSSSDIGDKLGSEGNDKVIEETMQCRDCDISKMNSSRNSDASETNTVHISCDKDNPSVQPVVNMDKLVSSETDETSLSRLNTDVTDDNLGNLNTETKDDNLGDMNTDGTVDNLGNMAEVKQNKNTMSAEEDIFKDFDDETQDLFESLGVNIDSDLTIQGMVQDDEDKLEESGDSVTETDGDEKEVDKAMGFFVRCFFPYLSVSKVREKLLGDQQTFQTWCAFVSCLQVLVVNDSDKYGVRRGSVIDHLLETHYHSNNSSVILGHISKLIKDSKSDAVYTCVKCHPYIQPVDVLYMCRFHSVAMDATFKQYMMMMVQQAFRTLRGNTEASLYIHIQVRCEWLDLLLSEEDNWNTLMHADGKPRLLSHKHQWKNQLYIENVLSVECTAQEAEILLQTCTKFGYWRGALRLTKLLGNTRQQLDTILHLGDLDLLSSFNDLGYLPSSTEAWESLMTDYMNLVATPDNQGDPGQADRTHTITVESLSLLLVQYIGPEATLVLLDRLAVPEGTLSADFYQSCLLKGMVHKHQKCVLHSMLEKVDSYLWSQRPTTLSPQLHYLVMQERDMSTKEPDASLQDRIQSLTSQLREDNRTESFIEDPECHWGVETKINLLCPCCNIALREPVSHEESGVILFRCGHGYHKLCLPERECLLCD